MVPPLDLEEALAGLLKVRPEEKSSMEEDYLALLKERECPVCHSQLRIPEDEELIGEALKGILTGTFGWHPSNNHKLFCGHEVRIQRSEASANGDRQYWLEPC